jgi:hypothetical protein
VFVRTAFERISLTRTVYNITEKRDPAIHDKASSMVISREEVANYPFRSCSGNFAGVDSMKKM